MLALVSKQSRKAGIGTGTGSDALQHCGLALRFEMRVPSKRDLMTAPHKIAAQSHTTS
jgi:hypothetical protein